MNEPEPTPQEARQGRTPGITRYVLGISLGLAIVALIVVAVIVMT